MVNTNKLKGKIVEMGMTLEMLSDSVGINRSTLYRKLNNDGETFTIKEADAVCKSLNLTTKEACDIFFSQYVA